MAERARGPVQSEDPAENIRIDYIYIYIYIDSLLRRLIILFLSFPYRLDRQLLLRCNDMINIPGKGTEPHVLCSVAYDACCA